jgi:hypothetical protein
MASVSCYVQVPQISERSAHAVPFEHWCCGEDNFMTQASEIKSEKILLNDCSTCGPAFPNTSAPMCEAMRKLTTCSMTSLTAPIQRADVPYPRSHAEHLCCRRDKPLQPCH